jgi:branched-chain amino acid transport system permease protein
MAMAPLLAGLAGVVFGWFCVRLSGVYLAMLTLAFAQIAWSTAFQWVELTGGDNGILGVWPSAWAAGKVAYYYLALALCVAAVLALRAIIFSPFGYALRAGRDSPVRAEAIGLDVTRINWAAFAVAACAAGIAGGLYAYLKGSVFPTFMAIPKSVDALLMVLLGGVQTVSGPIVGAFAFGWLQDWLVRLNPIRFTIFAWQIDIDPGRNWRFILGMIIVVIVLAFPQGLVGGFLRWRERSADEPAAEAAR